MAPEPKGLDIARRDSACLVSNACCRCRNSTLIAFTICACPSSRCGTTFAQSEVPVPGLWKYSRPLAIEVRFSQPAGAGSSVRAMA
eukprot:COSAG01_NODE_14097_length_1496_cov_1.392269_2_plen_85_part_01